MTASSYGQTLSPVGTLCAPDLKNMKLMSACFGLGGKVQTGLAILRYVDGQGYSPNTEVPDTKAWYVLHLLVLYIAILTTGTTC